ncbi:chitin disaccharide deacetylase [Virgibacillus halodenitrificans]|uniref:chitin disaccharide deacetylase n=1 Tax=Virgibacillus halodenitrificans TaxID=1482 RepID=UPI000304AB6B|nr:chitin disaccharide deacetylase [Virgibacillus halodenitrificans]MEC2158959.1 chitin disaccharide deacetylase [Virgibacillus halodenitrificans]MYL45413.1 chitin disaccharide deacetylase [Virgibacillus halodenitrificans]MYL57701.1 chitin disaccharide deacetylase [Virgibacillus halodenitrificans]
MKVLVNADDFGLTKGVTDGIVQSHLYGIVQSTTLMMNGLATEYAVVAAKLNPSLKVGIHLVLTWGKPLSNNVFGLTNEKGNFRYTNNFAQMEAPDLEEVEREWRSQLEAFLATGLPLHHIDSHHHIHGWAPLKNLVLQLANEYQVPVRYTDSLKNEKDILLTEALWLDFYGEGVDKKLFDKLQQQPHHSIEIMTHPAIVDNDLRSVSSYQEQREKELQILQELTFPNWVRKL